MGVRRTCIDEVLEAVRASAAPPLVVVTGWTGTGRSTVLAQVGRSLQAQGRTVIDKRFARDGVLLDRHEKDTTAARAGGLLRCGFAPVHGVPDELTARRAAATSAASLVSRNAVLLIDDAQWMNRDAVVMLEALAHRLAGTSVRCVCAVAIPSPEPVATAGVTALRRLRAAGLATSVRVPPFDASGTTRIVRESIGAIPAPELVGHVHNRSRGIAAAIVDVTSTLRRAGGVREVAGHAYLVPGMPFDLPQDQADDAAVSPLDAVRRLGPGAWESAGTAAGLEPAGPALPALLATALDTPVDEALARLRDLEAAGLLRRDRDGTWRFLVPMLGDRLRAALGPFERRSLAALVVEAVWRDEVRLAPPELADLVAVAGRLLPRERGHAALVDAAERAPAGTPRREARWWHAAAELATTDQNRVRARLEFTRACELAGDATGTLAGARGLLEDGSALPEPTRHELYVMLVLALHKNGDAEELDAVAEGRALWEADEAIRAICRVVALVLRGRWQVAYSLLSRTRPFWAARPATRQRGELLHWVGELIAGRLDHLEAGLVIDGPPEVEDLERRRHHAHWAIAGTVTLGDVRAGRDIARRAGIAESELFPLHRAVFALLEGRVDAPELARRACADDSTPGLEHGRAPFYQLFASLTLMQGQLSGARQLVAVARREAPPLDHVFNVADASIDVALGDLETARTRLEGALDRAKANGLVVGTELLLSLLVEVLLLSDDVNGARARAHELDGVAARLGSPRATVHGAFARALTDRDAAAADRCVRLAHETGQAFEWAHLALRLTRTGLADPGVLTEVYAFYGRLDAPLARAWTRSAMAARGVPIPGRAATKTENERLLAQLLVEGLTNRQIATVLGSSEKSVEGRLGRLFTRTGYRSRIELAAAMLEGTYARRT